MLDQKGIQAQLKNYKIRQGPLYKRSKFLKQWRQRWIVLTMNYLLTFTNKSCQEITDIVDLKDIKSYKSYLRKDEEMIPVGFKLRTGDDMFYLCAKSCHQKWSWIVTLERLMDYKYVGASTYNNVDWIRTRGFQSQNEFQTGKPSPDQFNIKDTKPVKQTNKDVDKEAEKIMAQLTRQQQQFRKKQQQLKNMEAQFIIQKQKLKQQKIKVQQSPPPPPPQQKVQPVQPVVQPVQKGEGSKVSQLRNMFEQKAEQSSKQTTPSYKIPEKKALSKQQSKPLHLSRAKIITGLFDQFVASAVNMNGFKFFIDFMVKIGSDETLGYNSFIVYQAKTHQNRKTFAEIFIELLTDYKDYEHCHQIANFIEICIFQVPGLFNQAQNRIIKKKLLEFFLNVNDDERLSLLIKSMYIMHKIEKYEKNQEMINKLDRVVKQSKRQQAKNWARKLKDDL